MVEARVYTIKLACLIENSYLTILLHQWWLTHSHTLTTYVVWTCFSDFSEPEIIIIAGIKFGGWASNHYYILRFGMGSPYIISSLDDTSTYTNSLKLACIETMIINKGQKVQQLALVA